MAPVLEEGRSVRLANETRSYPLGRRPVSFILIEPQRAGDRANLPRPEGG